MMEPIKHIEPAIGTPMQDVYVEMVDKFNQMIDVFNEVSVATHKPHKSLVDFCRAEQVQAARNLSDSREEYFAGKVSAYAAVLDFLNE